MSTNPEIVVFQMKHPWHWLTYGQNATAVGVFLSAVVNLLTIYVLWRTLSAVNRQAIAADRQAKAAEEQVKSAEAATTVSEHQLAAARDSAAAEREHSELLKQQHQAQLRPVLVFATESSQYLTSIVMRNESNAIALEISVLNGIPSEPKNPINIGIDVLGADAQTWLRGIDHGVIKQDAMGGVTYTQAAPVFARYKSQDGRTFLTGGSDLHAQGGFRQHSFEEYTHEAGAFPKTV